MRLSGITCCVVGGGRSIELARILGKKYGKVYFAPQAWGSDFPKKNIGKVGTGIGEFEVVDSPFTHIETTDLFVYPDIYAGAEQESLEREGHLVWGSRTADILETDRLFCKKWMEKHGLPVNPYTVMKGMDALIAHLKEHDDQWIKTSKYRGHMETTFIKNYDLEESFLEDLTHDLGANSEDEQFIVEDDMPDCFEIALDGYRIDGQQTKTTLYGIEKKDVAYLGMFEDYDKIPMPVKEFDEAITPFLKAKRARNFFCAEKRIDRKGRSFMVDACLRAPSPPGEAETTAIKNLPEIIYQGAQGILVEPEFKKKFVCEIMLTTRWAGKHEVNVQFPEEYRDNIKLWNAIKKKGKYYVLPQLMEVETIGGVVGMGNTKEEAVEECESICKEVFASSLKLPKNAIESIDSEIERAAEFGYNILGRK